MGRPTNPVLVVEDHADIREMLERVLCNDGYDVRTASQGIEALACLEHDVPCLILLDLMMPEMDGATFAARLHESSNPDIASTPIVLLTAAPVSPELQASVGALDVIRKPFLIRTVTKVVGQHCRSGKSCNVPD